MMISKRLIGTVKESKKYIAGNVICQWISLAANITMMGAIARMLQSLFAGGAVIPMLPAFPFLMPAAFCFARSSEKLDRGLRKPSSIRTIRKTMWPVVV